MPQRPDYLSYYLEGSLTDQIALVLRSYSIDPISTCYWYNEAPWDLDWRTLGRTFFLIPVAGELELFLDGHPTLVASPGSCIVIPPGVRHALRLKDGHAKLEQISIHCHIRDSFGRSLLSRVAARVAKFPDASFDTWIARFRTATHLFDKALEEGLLLLKYTMGLLLIDLFKSEQEGWSLSKQIAYIDPRIASVIEEVNRDPLEHYTVDQLAEAQQLTPTQFRKLFKQHMGTTPKIYLTRLKVDHASEQLRTTRLSIKEIAYECGFHHAHHFHSCFKKHIGKTPGEFRRGVIV